MARDRLDQLQSAKSSISLGRLAPKGVIIGTKSTIYAPLFRRPATRGIASGSRLQTQLFLPDRISLVFWKRTDLSGLKNDCSPLPRASATITCDIFAHRAQNGRAPSCSEGSSLVGPSPFDGSPNAFFMRNLRGEPQFFLRLGCRSKALARTIPVPRRCQCDRRGVAGFSIDTFGKLPDGDLHTRTQIVNLSRRPLQPASHQTARHIFHKNEIAAGDPAVFDWQRFAMQ